MVTLQELRSYMQNRAEEDKNRNSVQVTAPSIQEALLEASVELNLPVKKLEYEVLEKGNSGVFGVNKKNFILVVYEADEDEEDNQSGDLDIDFDAIGAESQVSLDQDGEIIVRLSSDGALVRVTSPVGKGEKAREQTAVEKLHRRGVQEYDTALLSKVIKQADGVYVSVGDFAYNPANDSIISVDITDHEMKAYFEVQPPGAGGIDQSSETILTFLKNNNVIHGIMEQSIENFENHPSYNEQILVAQGTPPADGENAQIVYNFDAGHSKVKLKEKNGRVDFKEMNLVQNVVEGQILAKKSPPEEGTTGRTVTGKLLPAKSGKDATIGVGKNVDLSEDGMIAKSTINGQVIIASEKLNVEPIYVVQGDVNLKTGGNVIFLGTVLVKGSVDDGFKVKASGNIEVMGNVGKAELDAEGDIIVHQGITGKGAGNIQAGKSVWAKFIENAKVEASEYVVASDGIINSKVAADKKVVCQGKRATIVGGVLRAGEEIHAKTFGSIAGSETILEVGYDPKSKEKLAQLDERVQKLDETVDEVSLNVHTLENLKKVKKELPEEKEQFLSELKQKQADIEAEKKTYLKDIEVLQEHLAALKIRGKIGASSKVFPGVRVSIKDAFLEVRNEFNAVTFVNEANVVKVTKYEELEEDLVRRK